MRENRSDREFERMLSGSVPEQIPVDVAAEVNPWKKAANRVLIGLVLQAVTLNSLCLNYILPAAGAILLLLGFRMLRAENRWFRACFCLTAVRTAGLFAVLVMNTTIAQSAAQDSLWMTARNIADAALLVLMLFAFWRGICAVQTRAGVPVHAGAAAALLVWYAIVCALGLAEAQGLLAGAVMIACFILIIYSLYRVFGEIRDAGYAIRTAPVRVTERAAVISLLAVLLAGCACGYAFCGSYRMQWRLAEDSGGASEYRPPEEGSAAGEYRETDEGGAAGTYREADEIGSEGEHRGAAQTESAAKLRETQDIQTQLLELGFPEKVLNDLTAEELESCAEAEQVIVHEADADLNENYASDDADAGNYASDDADTDIDDVYASDGTKLEGDGSKDKGEILSFNGALSKNESAKLHFTDVAVRLSGAEERWIIIHHFRWSTNPGFYGTECLQIWPAYRNTAFWSSAGETTGRMLCEKDGETLTADYAWLGIKTYSSVDVLGESGTSADIFAAFSLPGDGENCRGYVVYAAVRTAEEDELALDSWMNYTHQKSWLQYPAVTAMEKRMTTNENDAGAFHTINDNFQIILDGDLREN